MGDGFDVARRALFEVSETVTTAISADFVATVQQALSVLVPGDLIGWVSFDTSRDQVGSRGIPRTMAEEGSRRLRAVLHDHPMVTYMADGGREPKRVSDLICLSRLRATRTYGELFKPLHFRYQAAMVTSGQAPALGAWMVNRWDVDFSDRELETLSALHGPLCALEAASSAAVAVAEQSVLDARARARLTPREAQVLELASAGLTAVSIGYRLRISEATVRKHLEHIYDKLGCGDRMTAVQRSYQLGLLVPTWSFQRPPINPEVDRP